MLLSASASAATAADPLQPIPRNLVTYWLEVSPPGLHSASLYAEELGAGPPLLLIHGFGGSGYSWRRIVAALAQSNRVITLDLKGFGRSEKPDDTAYSAVHQAAYVSAFIERRRLTGVTVVGHSFGGAVALSAAIADQSRRPGRITRLVLMNAAAYPQPMTAKIDFLRQPILPHIALALIPPEIPAGIALSSERGNFAHITRRDIEAYARPLHESGGRHALIETARQIVPPNFAGLIARYPTIRQPALVIACTDDSVVPLSTSYRLSRALANARLRIIPGCDHVPSEETPAEVIQLLRSFLRG